MFAGSARRNYVELLKVAAAPWRVVRDHWAVFEQNWSPQMGVLWNGIERACSRTSGEKTPLLLGDMREVCANGAASLSRLSWAADSGELAPRVG